MENSVIFFLLSIYRWEKPGWGGCWSLDMEMSDKQIMMLDTADGVTLQFRTR